MSTRAAVQRHDYVDTPKGNDWDGSLPPPAQDITKKYEAAKALMNPSAKDTNPKDAVGTRKVPFSCMSGPVMAEVGLGMLEGACKYGRHNYRVIGVRAGVYFDAAQRHLWGWWEGQDLDPDSGIHHVSKLIADLMVLRDAMIQGNWVDDRPPKTPEGWVENFNKLAAGILDRYPNPKQAYVEKESCV